MQQELFAERDGCCGRTSPGRSVPTKEQTLRSWCRQWLGPISTSQKVGGKKPEWLSETTDLSSGECLTLNSSEWNHIPGRSPSDGAVCSLSSILERGQIDPRYFLSQKACAGILRRAEKRGKALPQQLHQALQTVAMHTEPDQGAPRKD